MLTSFFNKGKYELDGYHFRKLFEATSKAQLIDVRTPEERLTGSIESSININFLSSNFDSQIENLQADKTYFAFCHSGGRSAAAVNKMRKAGLVAYSLVGGIGAWPR